MSTREGHTAISTRADAAYLHFLQKPSFQQPLRESFSGKGTQDGSHSAALHPSQDSLGAAAHTALQLHGVCKSQELCPASQHSLCHHERSESRRAHFPRRRILHKAEGDRCGYCSEEAAWRAGHHCWGSGPCKHAQQGSGGIGLLQQPSRLPSKVHQLACASTKVMLEPVRTAFLRLIPFL